AAARAGGGVGVPPAGPPPPPAPLAAGGVRKGGASRSRPPAEAARLADEQGWELVSLGSAGAKAMAVVRGDADVYPHSGGQYEWDSAAPVAVARAAGLHTSRLDGSPLVYNRDDPYLPDLLICRPELAESAIATLARCPGPPGLDGVPDHAAALAAAQQVDGVVLVDVADEPGVDAVAAQPGQAIVEALGDLPGDAQLLVLLLADVAG